MSKPTEDPPQKLRGRVQLRQGEIIELDLTIAKPNLLDPAAAANHSTLAIVASHDCDINASAEKDPCVEFLPVKKVRKLDRTKTHTKSARSFQFEAKATEDGQGVFLEVDAPSRVMVEKSRLWGHDPKRPYAIDSEQVAEFADWLSTRYRRAALPNEFEDRYRLVRDRFWDLIRKFNHELSAVLFIFREGQERRDCPKNEPYTLTILLVHPGQEPMTSFDALAKSVRDLFESTYGESSLDNAGIEMDRCVAVSEYALSLAQYRRAIHHRVDWLSHESGPSGPLLNV
ncbi:MAG: hypothetical protein ACLQKY_03920 [Terracidiphilus sp.]